MLEKKALVDEFLALAAIDSESGLEGAIAAHVEGRLKALGLETAFDDSAARTGAECGNLIAKLPGRPPAGEGAHDPFFDEPILLNAHLDTVKPGQGVRPWVKGDVITSSGDTVLGADDKAGVAVALQVLQELHDRPELPHPPIEVVFTVAEETELRGSRELDYSLVSAEYGVALDGGELGNVIIGAPFKAVIDVEIQGLSAHAGEPNLGLNAIQVGALAIGKMRLGSVDSETTCNVGTFHAEVPINVIPDRAWLQFEVRSRDEEKLMAHVHHLDRCLREAAASFMVKLPEGDRRPSVAARTTRCYDGYRLAPDHHLVARVRQSADRLDIELKVKEGMGGSDANHLSSHGIAMVNMGVGMVAPHTTRESLKIYDLFKSARLLLMVLTGA